MAFSIWMYLPLLLTVLFIVGRYFGVLILEITVTFVLATFKPGVERSGKTVTGPRWRVPNGSVLERFIDGRANSEKWHKYGRVYRLWCGTHPEIVITTVEDLKHFSSDSNNHGKPPNSNMGWFVGEVIGECMGLLQGREWRRVRKIFEPPFSHSAAVSQIMEIETASRNYVRDLGSATASDALDLSTETEVSFAIPVLMVVTKFPYFLTASTIYGPMTKEEETELWEVTEERLALNPYLFIGGPYRFQTTASWFDRNSLTKLRAYQKRWRGYNTGLLEVRRSRGEKPLLVSLWEQYESGNLSFGELLQTLDELLMLNLDVFTHVLTWYITLIADHPSVKQQLFEEVKANENDMTQYLAKTESYLHRCFLESMRIRPFSIFTIGEYSHSVKNYGGVLVKPGTQTLVDILAINVRNSFWGANSEVFDPSRFEKVKPIDLRYNLHVFGIGSRKCMGQFVAGHIAKALIAHLFLFYDVVVLNESKVQHGYTTNKTSWTPKADTLLQLTRRGE